MTDARELLVKKTLIKIASEQNYVNPDIETAVLPNTGANFTSQIFTATIKCDGKKDLKLFAKAAVMGENILEKSGNLFLVEIFFYTDLLKKYQSLENKHNVPIEHRLLVPKYYGHSEGYLKEVIVFEDLSKQGFVTYDRLKSIDWNFASKAIKQLAMFHALSFALQRENPDYFKYAIKVLDEGKLFKENSHIEILLHQSKSRVVEITTEENKLKVQNFYNKFNGNKNIIELIKPKKIPVIIHSDFRQSNLMFKVDEDGQVQAAILDLQTLSVGSIAADLLYFIFTGSDEEFRAKHYVQLIEHYYKTLADALRRLHLDPDEVFPRADFDDELQQTLPYGLIMTAITLPLITIDVEDVANTEDGVFQLDSTNAIGNLIAKGNDKGLCVERLNGVINDYVKLGVV